jgi:hypothetical protein
MKNYPLLRKTMEHIEAHPEEHDQDYWGLMTACGTVMCFAGHAAVFDGATPIWAQTPSDRYPEMDAVRGVDGPVRVEQYAGRALGLTEKEADDLFWGADDIDDVRKIVAKFLAEEWQ